MKRNLIVVTLTVLTMFLVVGTNSAVAGPECFQATVIEVAIRDTTPPAGATNYRVLIECSASYTGSRAYYLTTDLGETGYATLLTAMSLKQTVRTAMTSWTSGSLVTEIRLNKTSE